MYLKAFSSQLLGMIISAGCGRCGHGHSGAPLAPLLTCHSSLVPSVGGSSTSAPPRVPPSFRNRARTPNSSLTTGFPVSSTHLPCLVGQHTRFQLHVATASSLCQERHFLDISAQCPFWTLAFVAPIAEQVLPQVWWWIWGF